MLFVKRIRALHLFRSAASRGPIQDRRVCPCCERRGAPSFARGFACSCDQHSTRALTEISHRTRFIIIRDLVCHLSCLFVSLGILGFALIRFEPWHACFPPRCVCPAFCGVYRNNKKWLIPPGRGEVAAGVRGRRERARRGVGDPLPVVGGPRQAHAHQEVGVAFVRFCVWEGVVLACDEPL